MTVVRCIDFETTGFPPRAGVCEAGWTDIVVTDAGIEMGETFSRLANPNMPIGEGAEKIHGITDAMVKDAPASANVFMDMAAGADVFCAHNAEFEQNFFMGGDRPWICTYKVALALFPEFSTHKNGDIPGHLGIGLDADRCVPLHRAGPDTYVTASILQFFLNAGHTVERLIEITRKPRQITRMPFGKHKGLPLAELPISYMRRAVENMDAKDVREAIQRELDARSAA